MLERGGSCWTRVEFISEWNCKRVSRFWIKRLAATTFRAELKRQVALSLKAGYEVVEFYIFSVSNGRSFPNLNLSSQELKKSPKIMVPFYLK